MTFMTIDTYKICSFFQMNDGSFTDKLLRPLLEIELAQVIVTKMGCCLGKSNQDAQITFIPEVETFLKSIQSQAQWSSVEVDGLRSILNPLAQEKTFPRVSSKILKRSEKEVDFNPEGEWGSSSDHHHLSYVSL